MADDETDNRRPLSLGPELPAPGYPLSEEAVGHWFRQRYGHTASSRELGAIIDAMAERETTAPVEGPYAEPEGWLTGPSAAPATRR